MKAESKADDTIATVTFGGPRVGRRPFKEIYDKMIPSFSFHFRNPDGDPVSDPKSKESYYESRIKDEIFFSSDPCFKLFKMNDF